MVSIRYENPQSNFITRPFELGIRHLKVAFCDDSQENLTKIAKERIIYRPFELDNNQYKQLSLKERVYHAAIGLSETLGYVTIVTPFVAAAADKIFGGKPFYPKGGYPLRTHMEEGGNFEDFEAGNLRRNPFDQDAAEDVFYQGASWLPLSIDDLTRQAEIYAKEHYILTFFHANKEEASDQILNYIKEILYDSDFQKDPKAYMEAWKLRRGTTEELRIPEDIAAEFFASVIK